MPRSLLLALIAAVALAVGGCVTTGDPKAGGLFGWSESKARQRQAEARAALDQEERRGTELQTEKQRLQSQIHATNRQLETTNRRLETVKKNISTRENTSASPGESNQAELAEIRRLEQDKARLEREIDQLHQETLILMDL